MSRDRRAERIKRSRERRSRRRNTIVGVVSEPVQGAVWTPASGDRTQAPVSAQASTLALPASRPSTPDMTEVGPTSPSDDTESRSEAPASTGVGELLRIAAVAHTFRRPDGGYSLSRQVDGHTECHDLDSSEVRRWLTQAYYESTGRLPSAAALSGARYSMAAHADMSRFCAADFVRVGSSADGATYFLDLGDPTWRAVAITAQGWQVVARPEVHFRRAQGQLALPTPARDGEFALLRNYVNVENNDMPLLVAWITAALRPVGPHPILVITGEQGSAKSTLARICRLLVDPHSAPFAPSPENTATSWSPP